MRTKSSLLSSNLTSDIHPGRSSVYIRVLSTDKVTCPLKDAGFCIHHGSRLNWNWSRIGKSPEGDLGVQGRNKEKKKEIIENVERERGRGQKENEEDKV